MEESTSYFYLLKYIFGTTFYFLESKQDATTAERLCCRVCSSGQ